MAVSSPARSPRVTDPISYGDLLASHTRGGFVWTRVVSQRIGALVAVPSLRAGVHPSTLTAISLFLGVASSVVAIVLVPDRRLVAGVVAFVGWQLAYGFDCADGQVARASGRTSVAGARMDVTADYAIYLATIVTLVVAAGAVVPAALLVAAGFGYGYQLFDEVTGRGGDADQQAIDRDGALYQSIGFFRDGGTQRAVAAVCIGWSSWASAGILLALGGLGLAHLVGRLAVLDRRSR